MNKMTFDLNKKELKKLKKWKKSIKKKYGQYGTISYTFIPTGIGNAIFVSTNLDEGEKNITDYSCW